MNQKHPREDRPGNQTHRVTVQVFLVLGMLAFLFIFALKDGRDIFPSILASFLGGDLPSGDDAVAVSGLFMLAVIAVASPFLHRWLELSRLLTHLLRWSSLILAACFWFFLIRYGAYSANILLPLALSPTFTFTGLCLIRQPKPTEVQAS